jgi:hypothetical protein
MEIQVLILTGSGACIVFLVSVIFLILKNSGSQSISESNERVYRLNDNFIIVPLGTKGNGIAAASSSQTRNKSRLLIDWKSEKTFSYKQLRGALSPASLLKENKGN